jgi:hypothetical protein
LADLAQQPVLALAVLAQVVLVALVLLLLALLRAPVRAPVQAQAPADFAEAAVFQEWAQAAANTVSS